MSHHPLPDSPTDPIPFRADPDPAQSRTLRQAVDQAMSLYFSHLDGENVTDLYTMVMAEVEAPLLQSVMDHTRGNQTQASQILGLNRGTLRKKLKQYNLI